MISVRSVASRSTIGATAGVGPLKPANKVFLEEYWITFKPEMYSKGGTRMLIAEVHFSDLLFDSDITELLNALLEGGYIIKKVEGEKYVYEVSKRD